MTDIVDELLVAIGQAAFRDDGATIGSCSLAYKEIERLRKIEAAVLEFIEHPDAPNSFVTLAMAAGYERNGK